MGLSLLAIGYFITGIVQIQTVSSSSVLSCPRGCDCIGLFVDCSFKDLTEIPSNLPTTVESLDLQGNKITTIRRDDFKGLESLQSLRLLDNSLTTIEDRSFDDLVDLREILLNRNDLADLPDRLFINCRQLTRIDASSNNLVHIRSYLFKGTVSLTKLELENNALECIARDALTDSPHLSILSLQRNNLGALSPSLFSRSRRLSSLRLAYNPLQCDCRSLWLSHWLRANPTLAMFARCSFPASLKGRRVAEVDVARTLKCDMASALSRRTRAFGGSAVGFEDEACADRCPVGCVCSTAKGGGGIVNCSRSGFVTVPKEMPKYTKELLLEKNDLREIPSNAFEGLGELDTLDLNSNKISVLHPGSFKGLQSLKSLRLSGNRLKECPVNVFQGLPSLKALFLNSNDLACIPPDSFSHLTQLNLLSLFDNKIMTLSKGMFNPLKNLQTLHLAGNPLLCNCRLRWLGEYLRRHPVESSKAVCRYPERLAGREVSKLYQTVVDGSCLYDDIGYDSESSAFDLLTPGSRPSSRGRRFFSDDNGDAVEVREAYCGIMCPPRCRCYGDTVNCTGAGLTVDELGTLPPHTKVLELSGNKIGGQIPATFFADVPLLEKADFSRNRIERLTTGTFDHATNLVQLLLTDNLIEHLEPASLRGLGNLRFLMFRNNRLTCVKNSTFTHTPKLRLLSFYGNRIGCLQQDAFSRLTHLETLNLLDNPIYCDCRLRWFPRWASNAQRDATVAATCATPRPLAGVEISTLDDSRLHCYTEDEAAGAKPGAGCRGAQECCVDVTSEAMKEGRQLCHPPSGCPDMCSCSDTELRCSRRNVTDLPKNIAVDTTEMYFDGNLLTELPLRINRYPHLTSLDLNSNRLRHLPANLFRNLTQLRILILSNNRIQCVSRAAFVGLGNLRMLSIHNNRIMALPHGVFDGTPNLSGIEMSSNPLRCDCQAKWLAQWIRRDYRESGVAKCASPHRMKNAVMYSSHISKFQCLDTDDEESLYQTITDDVMESGAEGEGSLYKCGSCTFQTGRPSCHSGGTCRNMPYGRYSCRCPVDRSGPFCEKSAIATIVVDGTDDGVYDAIRDTLVLPKTHQPGARKKTKEHSTKPPTRNISRALFPQFPINKGCDGNRCEHRSVCREVGPRKEEYTCNCQPGWTGKYCEKLYTLAFSKTNAYAQLFWEERSPLRNITIQFITTHAGGLIYYQGGRKAYLAVEIVQGRLTVSVHARGDYVEGVVSDAAAAMMRDASVVDDEETERNTVPGERRKEKQLASLSPKVDTQIFVSDGKLHNVSIIYRKDGVLVQADNREERYLLSIPGGRWANANLTSYLSKKPGSLGGIHYRMQLDVAPSFQGCMLGVHANSRQVDFEHNNVVKFRATKPCLPKLEAKDNACLSRPCRNGGECLPLTIANPIIALSSSRRSYFRDESADFSTFKCKCKHGFFGRTCNQKGKCRSISTKETITDPKTGCTSKNAVRQRKCTGECGASCCAPTKFRHKSVRFVCRNGSDRKYSTVIPLVRKCSCSDCA